MVSFTKLINKKEKIEIMLDNGSVKEIDITKLKILS